MTTRELIGIAYSPWTEKAKWALDHHKLSYSYSEHLIMLGMPALRVKMKSLTGELTVPALIDGEKRIIDSFEIARHADEVGSGSKLFSQSTLEKITHLNELSETALDAGRALVMARIARDPEAQKESLPPFVPSFARGAFRSIVSMAMSYLDREFDVKAKSVADREEELHNAFASLSRTVKEAGDDCLLGKFSYADIAGAAIVHLAEPVDEKYIRLTPALKRCWANPELKAEYPHLIKWRDTIYSKYRGTRAPRTT